MDFDQKTLERIAVALERIAKALEINPPHNASVFTKDEIVADAKGIVSQTLKATPIPATRQVSTPTVQSALKPAVVKEYRGLPKYISFQSVAPSAEVLARFANGTPVVRPGVIKPPNPKPAPQNVTAIVPLKTKNIPIKKVPQKQPVKQQKKPPAPKPAAKKKMAELLKTRAGQQLNDFFVKLGLTILNPDSLEPKVEHQKLANAIWSFRSVAFDLMGNINSAIHRKTVHTVDLTEKTKSEKASITGLCDSLKKVKLITYDRHDDCVEIRPGEDKTNYFSGKWGEDVILTQALKVKDLLNEQQGKQICSVFRHVEYKKDGSDKWIDSECDVVFVVNGKFYFIEVKTGKQLNVDNYVKQVEHLENKKEYSIYCSIDKEKVPEEIKSLCMKPNFSIFDFENFEASLKKLITKRQHYPFETPSPGERVNTLKTRN